MTSATPRSSASGTAKWYRDGDLVLIRVPTEAEERVRDLVRCRETFQKEILSSRHYILKFLRRRGFVYRDGTNWSLKHFEWLRHLLSEHALTAEDEIVLSEYLSLLEYKLQCRDELDRRIEELALTPFVQARRGSSALLPRHRHPRRHGAGHRDR